jgi:hypothetical protein
MDAEDCEPYTDVFFIKFSQVSNARYTLVYTGMKNIVIVHEDEYLSLISLLLFGLS